MMMSVSIIVRTQTPCPASRGLSCQPGDLCHLWGTTRGNPEPAQDSALPHLKERCCRNHLTHFSKAASYPEPRGSTNALQWVLGGLQECRN